MLQAFYNNSFKELIEKYKKTLTTEEKKEKIEDIEKILNDNIPNSEEEKSKAFIAYIYYNIIKSLKGEHALYLMQNLRNDLEKDSPRFEVPDYIKKAVKKILE